MIIVDHLKSDDEKIQKTKENLNSELAQLNYNNSDDENYDNDINEHSHSILNNNKIKIYLKETNFSVKRNAISKIDKNEKFNKSLPIMKIRNLNLNESINANDIQIPIKNYSNKNNKIKRSQSHKKFRSENYNKIKIEGDFLNSINNSLQIKNNSNDDSYIKINSPNTLKVKKTILLSNSCSICYGELTDPYTFECCNQKYCHECVEIYFSQNIKLDFIFLCPNSICRKQIELEIVSNFLKNEKFLQKFNIFKEMSIIVKIEGYIFCPIPDCDSYAIKNNNSSFKNNNFIECIKNKHLFCSKCRKGFHKGDECKEDIIVDVKEMLNNNIRKCPKCKIHVQKISGCNHMKCLNIGCYYEFCWLCMNEYNQVHYDNPFIACFKKSNEQNLVQITTGQKCYAIFRGLGILLLALILLTFILSLHTIIIGIICGYEYAIKKKKLYKFSIDIVNERLRILFKINSIVIYICVGMICLNIGFIATVIIILTCPFWLFILICYLKM